MALQEKLESCAWAAEPQAADLLAAAQCLGDLAGELNQAVRQQALAGAAGPADPAWAALLECWAARVQGLAEQILHLTETTEPAAELLWRGVSASWPCLETLRNARAWNRALQLEWQLEQLLSASASRPFQAAAEGALDECLRTLDKAASALVSLNLDLGRPDRAQLAIATGRSALGRASKALGVEFSPIELGLASTRHFLLLGEYARATGALPQPQAGLDLNERLSLERLPLIARIYALMADRDAASDGAWRQSFESLRLAAREYLQGLMEANNAPSQPDAERRQIANSISLLAPLLMRLEFWAGDRSGALDLYAQAQSAGYLQSALGSMSLSELGLRAALLRGTAQLAEERAEIAAYFDARISALFAGVKGTPQGTLGMLGNSIRRESLCQALLLALDQDQGPERALQLLLKLQVHGSQELAAGLLPPEPARVQACLDRLDAGLLAYLPGEFVTLICALDRRGPRWFEVAGGATHAADLQTIARELAGHSKQVIGGTAAARVSQWLLPAELREWTAEWSHTYLVGRDLLANLDFEVLPYAGDQPWGLVRSSSYLPSLPFLLEFEARAKRAETTRSPTSLVLAATGMTGPGVKEALPASKDLFKALSGPKRWEQALLNGQQASLSGIQSGLSPETQLLTVFAHGVVNYLEMYPTGILLAGPRPSGSDGDNTGGSVASYGDLRGLTSPPLVALLTCHGALGHPRAGDGGLDHPAGAFLLSGADSVLAPQRRLDARLGVELYQRWIAELKPTLRPSEALLRARQALWQFVREQPASEGQANSLEDILTGLQCFGLARPIGC